MPYIKDEYRKDVNSQLEDLINMINTLPEKDLNGIVTYVCYKLVKDLFWQDSWDKRSDGRKCLDEASREFCRRVIEPYEDLKIIENGDI